MKELIAELKSKNIFLSVDNEELVIDFDGDDLSYDLISKIKDNKCELINYLGKYYKDGKYTEIPVLSLNNHYSISDAQRRLWVLSQFEGGSAAYNMPRSIYLNQNIEIGAFKRAINFTIERHEILRTVFRQDESGEIRQWVLDIKELGFSIDYEDFRKEVNKKEKAEAYIAADSYRTFDLAKGPLLRAALLQVEKAEYVFYFNMHHIISDGWSMEVLTKDVLKCYEAYKADKVPELEELRIQYKDYSAWQLAQLNGKLFKTHRAYWLDKLSGKLPLLDLPTSKLRPKANTYKGHSVTTYLDKATTAKLKGYTRENGGSLFMGLLASWNVLMYRYTSQKDIIIGTPVAGREHADLEDQIGFYLNTLALRNEVNPEESFDRFYSRVKADTLKSYSHQMYPFDRLVGELNLQRDTSRSAVFDVLLDLHNGGRSEGLTSVSPEEINQISDRGYRMSKFDIEVIFQEVGDYLSIQTGFNTDVYEEGMIEGLIKHYKQLLTALLETPEEKISQIEYLSEQERNELLVIFNDTAVAYPKDKTIMDLFDEQAAKTPDKIALVFAEKKLTYRQLNEKSNQLAAYLQNNYDIQPDDLIGIQLGRNEWMIISILGILKAGGAYVPIDPEYPSSRKEYIVKDSAIGLLITEAGFIYDIDYYEGEVFAIDVEFDPDKYSAEALTKTYTPGHLAYVIYTSGSTGNPKGVMVEHASLTNYLKWGQLNYSNDPSPLDFGLFTSLSFDLTVTSIFLPLISGGALTVFDSTSDVSTIVKEYFESEISCIKITPAHISLLGQLGLESTKIQVAIVGGEQLADTHVEILRALNPAIGIYNEYGPTESTVGCAIKEVGFEKEAISIGSPIANTQIYILNETAALQPIGVIGEICIGGNGLARGYLNREELTKEKFITSPFKEGERLYKTGDLGRWLQDGNIAFIGRKDDQVKIRGYRIELGEIEHALLSHEEIGHAVVLAKENGSRERELVAYITSHVEQNTGDLRDYLKEQLPAYMLPAHFVQLKGMPLTANGKVDKKALPAPKGLGLTSVAEYVAPRTELEEKLVKIWEEVLERGNIGVNNDFFALGGHSLKAIRLGNEYQKELSAKLSLKELFAHTSVASHAVLIASSAREAFVQIEKVTPQVGYAISDGQRRLWVLSQFEGVSAAYNMPGSIYLNQDIEIENFIKAIDAAIERHEILRTVFREEESGEIRQWVLERNDLGFSVDCQDFRKETNKQEKAEAYIAADAYRAFDLAQGPLLRAALLRVEEKEYVFYFNMHHIISDGWSREVLAKDVLKYYEVYKAGKEPELEELRIQYKDYSSWQLAQLREESFKAHKEYWLDKLSGALPLLDLPGSKQRPQVKTYNGQGLATYVDKATTAKLKGYIQENGGSLFMGLLACWNVLMYRYTSEKDIIIGIPVAGRDHADLEDQIGFYVNTLALRNRINPEESFDSFYRSVKEDTLKSYSHQMYPFDRLVEELDLERDTSRSAVFDITLIVQNNDERIEGFELSEKALNQIVDQGYNSRSKFDIEVTAQEVGDYLSMSFVFNPDVYEKAMVEGLITHYKQLLKALLETPEEKISRVDYLSEHEKHELLVTFNDTAAAYPKDKTVVDLFEVQAAKAPDNVAIVFKDTELTYRELNEKSNQLAHYLGDNYDIQPDDLIGIKQERSEWMIVSILGALKAGGAYVPIDPEYPQERIEYIEQDTRCKVCLDETELTKFKESQEHYSKEPVASVIKERHLAYVIYTSGSTGKPKGVVIEHRSLCNLCAWHQQEYKLDSQSRATLFSGVGFDALVWELFPYITSGGSVYPISNKLRSDTASLVDIFNKFKITHAFIPTILYKDFVVKSNDLAQNIKLCIGGEALLTYKKTERIELFNNYGPTENTVVTTSYHVKEDTSGTIPIGKPISNTQIYLLNEEEELQPVGVIGEICIGGDGLARGYLNQEELTQEKFIGSPFREGERLYKTGDLGRWLQDGNIEFLGRKDDQVKIRGYRIELGEIEHALVKHEEIKEAVVLARENESGEKELVAYITSHVEQNTSDLRAYLTETLPVYMLPAYFVQLEAMPLTANGKIDRKSLPDPEGLGLSSGVEYVAPRTEREKVLALVWSAVLKREGVGIRDSFYNLGGDSIKSIQVVARLKQQGYKLKVEHLLRTPVLEELARLMELTTQVTDQSEVSGEVVLTPIQKWFFKASEIKVHNHFNQSVLLHSKEQLESKILEKSIDDLTRHHDALRMVYKQKEGGWEQFNQDTSSNRYTIDFYDLRESDNAPGQMSEIGEQLQSSIKLSEGPLFRVLHFRLKDGDRLGLIIHHLVVDGVSWRILLEDLSSLYSSYKAGEKPGLPLKTDPFQRWALRQKEYAAGKKLEKERAYWQQVCDRQIEGLPQDKVAGIGQAALIDSAESFGLDKKTTELLQTRVHGVYNTEINDVLLASLGLALKEVLSADKSVLKMEGHGREEILDGVDISRTVGWFTTIYPFVLDVSAPSDQTENLVRVKESLRRIPNKGIGYGILNYLSQEGLESKLIPEITFNYLGDFGANVSNDDGSLFEYASEYVGSNVSKENLTDAILDVSGMLVRGELGMSIRYSSARYHAATIRKLAGSYKKNLEFLIEELAQSKERYLTPSDLSFKGLSQEELSKLNSDNTLEDVYELSPLQEGIYYHWLAETSSSLYFEQISYRVRAKVLAIEKLKGAYDRLTARHGVLRTSFSTDYAGRSLQMVRKEVRSNFSYEKLDSQADREAQVVLIKRQDRERGFDLSRGSQMRLHVIDLSEGEYEFIWSHHHILMDGWCVSVLINDFNELLSAAMVGRVLNLAPALPYANYINWLRAIDREGSLSYWKDYLKGYSSLAEIPFKARAAETTYVEFREHLQIGGDLFKKVDALCTRLGITHNTFVQGVWGYLLSRYNNSNDVVFGAVVSGRPADLSGVEEMIGLFSNTIPVRVKYDADATPVTLLQSLQEQSIRSGSHHYMNLSAVQSQSEPGMNLMDHIMIFENYAVKELENEGVFNSPGEEGLSIASSEVFERTNYDFNIVVSPSAVSLGITIKYNLNSYDQLSLQHMVDHLDKMINEFVQNADQSLRAIDYLSEEEKHTLLVTFNDTAVSYPKDKTIVDLFEEQVAKTPDNIAVVFEDTELTYKELNEKSNQLAHYLREQGVREEKLVPICVDRGLEMLISILGILKAGGTYVPIDPAYPQERISYMLADTAAQLVVITSESEPALPGDYAGLVVVVDRDLSLISQQPKTPLVTELCPNHSAYVIYTSGSTGKPKGVLIRHSNVVRLFFNETPLYDFNERDTWTLFHSFCFDFSVWEMYGALFNGGRLVIVPKWITQDANAFTGILSDYQVTVLNQTPSAFYTLQECVADKVMELRLRYVIFGGEALNPAKIKPWKDQFPACRLVNMYGITETTVHVTYQEIGIEHLDNSSSVIGKAIPTVTIFILDSAQQLVPIGVAGELCVGGAGLATGYLNQWALTAEKFIESPFKEGERLYKTGDLGRWLADGNIEFLGRKDDQVKVRGYRIELGEIEHALVKHEEIKEAVVLARENESGEKELVAYITSHVEQNTSDLRAYLTETLPVYMLPAYFVQLEAMPLTANGKIDRKSLPDPEGLGLSSGVEYVAPRTEREKVLALVWSAVLKREGVGIRDSFYNLGGDSIKSIQVVARLKQQGYKLKVEHLLRTPVLEELARLMELTTQVTDQSEVSGEVVLTPIQEWFFKASEIKVHDHFNQSVLLHSKEQLESKILEKSIDDLTRHHDALRMVYKQKEGGWEQFNQDTSSNRYTIDFYDLRESDNAPGQMSEIGEQLQSSIKLSEGPLFRVLHFRLKDGDRLGLIIHHLVVDGVSWRILLEDLSSLYSSYKAGEKPGLPLKTDPFQRWALRQKEYAAGKKLEKERAYWQQVCDRQIEGLPQDKVAGIGQAALIDSAESFGLDKKTTELLQTRVHGVYNTEINDVLLASLGLALKEVLSADKSVLKMEGHGREEILDGVDISRTVGWFTTVYPFVLDVSAPSDQTENLVRVKESLRRIPNKGIGYGILDYLSQEGLESKLIPEITFNYLGDFGANASNDDGSLFEYASEYVGSNVSKENLTDAILDVSGMLVRGELGMSIRYSKSRYHATTIKKLAGSYKKNLEFLIEELAKSKERYLTPSDLSFKGLSQEELSKLNSDNTLEDVYELSPLQEGIYYHWLAETSSSLYFEQISYRVRAKVLAIEKLKGAYDRLTARHGVLRTSFSTDYAGRSLQIVRKEVPSAFTYEKIERQADSQLQVGLIRQQDRERGFDLSRGSQMRLHVIDLSEGEYEFIWSHHHILMDGWCVSVLINDFNELLSAAMVGRELDLAPALPYANYINWLRAIDRESSLSYWKDYLKGYSSLAEIPFKARAAETTYVDFRERLQIGGDLFKKVGALCTRLGITHNTFVQGVWGYLLSRYNNTNDVVFGAVVSGRPADLSGVEEMIGLFSNTIPVRVKYDADATPVTLLQSLQEQSIRSGSHHYMNLSAVQSQSELGMNLMDHIMIFENYAVKELENEGVFNSPGEEGLSIEAVEVFDRTNYDFNITIAPSPDSLNVDIRYNANRYDKRSLKHLIDHLDKLINEFTQNDDQSLRAIDYLSEAERHELLFTFNDTAVAYPKDKTIVDLFEEQVSKTPDHIAVVFEDTELTYGELNEKSNQLAHYLRDNYDVQPDDLIGIQLERSEWMIISILGILKAGGAYVPIDPEYPSFRKEYIVKDSAIDLLITEASFIYDIDYYEGEVFAIDVEFDPENYSSEALTKLYTPRHLAYVIYTSGSTGNPKGVMVEHASLTNYLKWGQLNYSNDPSPLDFGLFTSLSFDLTVTSIFLPLISGGALTVFDSTSDVSTIVKEYFESEISCIKITPAHISLLGQLGLESTKIQVAIVGGEQLADTHVEILRALNPAIGIYNEYGPTESTVGCAIKEVGFEKEAISIGSPIANTQIYILNETAALQPIGVIGEICIGGNGLARGYLNQEGLTKEKFITNPFKEGDRLYKTGDLGRWLPDGNIAFIGRKDDQVKIRGYRIELGEIEHALLSHEEIGHAVVLAKENGSRERELVAYITSHVEQNTGDLRDYLKEQLPAYMLPAHFVQLKGMPLTANGKVDKKALPAPKGLGLTSVAEYVAPRTELEEKLVKIWEEVLERGNIGVNNDFFALGGHSLKAIRLGNEYQKELSAKLSLKELFAHTSVASHAVLIASSAREAFVQIEKVTPQVGYAISDGQRRLWVLSQFEGVSAAYNMPGSIYLNQDIEIENFIKAIDAAIERHEILRTVFREEESGEIRQWVLERNDLGFSVDCQDFRKETNKQEKAEAYIAADAYRAFDLAQGPLLRAALLRVEEKEYVFYFNMHHIISDGWSREVLAKDVLKYYEVYKAGKEPELEELRIQYKDYSSWQLAQLREESFKAHKEYWLDKLSGALPLLDLPGSKQRPQVKTYNGQGLATYVDKATTAKLKGYIQENGGSLFMGLLACWNVLMYRYTSEKDIIIGIPVAGRDHADLEDQIGFYVNTLALRNRINPEESFDSFYRSVKEDTLKSYSHQMYPFDRLVEELDLERDTSRSPVFDISITYHNITETGDIGTLDDSVINHVADNGPSKVKNDIELHFGEVGDHILFKLIYNGDVYERSMIERLMEHFKGLLSSILSHPEEKISQIDYLSEEEKHELLVTFNDTAVSYPKDKTIVDLFEEQTLKTPDGIAVVFAEKELTYSELNERSNQLAHYLRDNYDIQPDDLIGIQLDRSEWMIISMLGVLKSGGAYVPIDPEYPSSRKEYIVKDSSIDLLITEASFLYDIDYYDGEVVAIDLEFEPDSYSSEALPGLAASGHLAYVIYTSGSTGNPKGVMIEHRSIANTILSQLDEFKITSKNRGLQFASFSFDASVWETFIILLSGARLFVADESHRKDPDLLTSFINTNAIDIATLSPSYLSKIEISALKGLKTLITAGEPAHYEKAIDYVEYGTYYNAYGPTETSICGAIFKLDHVVELLSNSIPIGKPIANTQIYILNDTAGLQAVGVIGEIYIGGNGLARGYLNQEGLTKEKFITNPFKDGERLYKTGDLGRWLADGNIEFLGRKDDQVKIRGYRIELGEIEHALLRHEEINEAVVITKENESGEKELAVYLTSKVEQNTSDLRSYLSEKLPSYMLPAYFVQLEAFPLTANGKIEKKSLPDPEGLGLSSDVEYVAPRTEQEKVLALVWAAVLKREGIGIRDSFYNLGGDSIKSIQVVARLKQLGYKLKVEHLLRTPVLEELARLIELTAQLTDQREVIGEVVLTPIQEWFFKSLEIKVHDHYNQSVLLYSKEELDRNILEKSIADLTRHHDALRMVYKQTEGAWQQFSQDTSSKHYTIDFYDLRESDDALARIMQLGEALQSSISITEGPLLRVAHFRVKDGDRLGLIIHHLVVDGVSWRILLEDLSNLYSNYKKGEEPRLPSKTDSFQRWALLQKEYAAGKKLERERAYWQEVCRQEVPKLSGDKAVKESQVAVIDASESLRLDKQTTELLQTRVHGVYNTEINDVLLTSLGLALKEVLLVDKSVLKMEGHGREEILDGIDISRTVGWFTTVYPFVLDVSDPSDKTENLVRVKESLRSIPNKGIGYGILTHLSQEGLESKLTPEITFNYLGDFGANVSHGDGDSLFEYASGRIGSEVSKENGNDAVFDISGMLVNGELGLSIRYSKARHHSATINKLAKSYKRNLQFLIEGLAKSKERYLTPSDLTFRGLSRAELSKINPDHTLEDVYELSPLQEGIYYHWLVESSSSLYFEQVSYRVRAKVLPIEKLKDAYDQLTARHAVLRTSFSTEYAGRSLQIVRKEVPSAFTYEKIERQADPQLQVGLIRQQDRERGFDLRSGSQMRLHVIDLSEGEYEFIWSHHHILMDGWCVSVLINDFNELLSTEVRGSTAELQPVMPYSNYINWLRAIDRESSLSYWKDYLSGYSTLAQIPFKAATGETTYAESREHLQIGGDLFKKVEALCTQLGITHNIFVQGVWGYLLSRYNNTNDVVFGAVVSGRPADLPGVEEMIGLFINTIPVRVRYDPDATPVTLLQSLQEQSIRSNSHHYINLSEVQSQSELGMNLIDHIMVFENYAVKELESEGVFNSPGEEGLSIEAVEVFERNNYDFNITIAPSPASLNVDIKYNTNRYDKTSLKHLVDHLDKLINEFAQNPDQSLRAIDYLSEAERHELLFTHNDTAVAYPKDKTIVDLFEEQVSKTPDHVAVVFEETELTYRELNERSNQLAHYLRDSYDIQPDDLVGIQLDRSEWMIVSILGVLKSGGAYVPIDPDYPAERIAYILDDSCCKACVDEKELIRFRETQNEYLKSEVITEVKANNLAYVIYTSGSTGKPKGVLIEHRSLINYNNWFTLTHKISQEDSSIVISSPSFDGILTCIYGCILNGGSLHLLRKEIIDSPTEFIHYVKSKEITFLKATPPYLNLVINSEQSDELLKCKALRFVMTGGDKVDLSYVNRIIGYSSIYVINHYGPTESTIGSASFIVTSQNLIEFKIHKSIGHPIFNVHIYFLNEALELQPKGVIGEMYIGGEGLARGYLNQPELTQEKFIASPFKEGERLYKTGDLGRWLADGNIEFIGRRDDQVKVRGYRIELGEIEHALLNYEEINQAVVIAKENESADKELVAYLTSQEKQNANDLRAYLQEKLPAYMVPVYFVQLEELPLTANGKIDKKSLPDPEGLGLSSGVEYVAPRNELEEQLVKICEEVLHRENIGILDDFFYLGMDSLKVIRLIALIHKKINIELRINDIFENTNIYDLGNKIDSLMKVTQMNRGSSDMKFKYEFEI